MSWEEQEEQRRKDELERQKQVQKPVSSSKNEQQEKNIDDIKNSLHLLQQIITKGIDNLLKDIKENTKETKKANDKDNNKQIISQDGLNKALNKIGGTLDNLIDGNLKGIASNFAEGAGRLGVIAAGIIKGLELANKITEKQAEINKTSYLLGGEGGTNFGGPAIARKQALLSGMFGYIDVSKENINRYAQELSGNYALNLMSNEDLTRTTRVKAALEGTLGALGVNAQSINQLQFNASQRYNIENDQFGGLYSNLSKSQIKSTMPMQKFIDGLNAMSNQSIKYNGSLEYANGLLEKFGNEVNKGTISLESLTAVSSGIAHASVAQNAGLGAYLMQTGNLPPEAMKFAGSPLGLAGWMHANPENIGLQRGLENAVRTEAYNSGFTSKEELQSYFRMRYAGFGFNLDQKQYEKLAAGESLTPDDIKKMVEGSNKNQEQEFYKKASDYYDKTTSLFKNVENITTVVTNSFLLNPEKTMIGLGKILNETKPGEIAGENLKEKGISLAKNAGLGALHAALKLIPGTSSGLMLLDDIVDAIKAGVKEGAEEGTKNTKATVEVTNPGTI